jgi:hypothetical protein
MGDVKRIVEISPTIQKAIANARIFSQMRISPPAMEHKDSGSFPAPPPYSGGLGNARFSLTFSGNGCYTVTITDTYDFDARNRGLWAELKVGLVRAFGEGKPYPVTGSYIIYDEAGR